MKKAIIIGSGFAGLSAAAFMAKAGWHVTVLEKHSLPGGRARKLSEDGFTFDMGPSWYWMPDVFERFFNIFDKRSSDFFKLIRLDPSYRVYWADQQMDVSANYEKLKSQFESTEEGSALRLDKFLKEAEYKYDTGMKKLVFSPSLSIREYLNWELLKGIFRLDVFGSIKKHIYKFFKHPKLRQLLEFPVLFLGALPENTPALYSLMNYADMKLGTWYPEGGMFSIVDALYKVAVSLGVNFVFECEVQKINVNNGMAISVTGYEKIPGTFKEYPAEAIIGAADYNFIETRLLEEQYQSYSSRYWESRKMAPSCLLYYIGLNKKLVGVLHHSLFFDKSFDEHARDIYVTEEWPQDPLFYVCTASITDEQVAPQGCENLFFLIPVAAGIKGDSSEIREEYFEKIMTRFENLTGQEIRNSIILKKTFGPSDFSEEYNAFKGNAYGMANTLLQTAILKPSCRSKKIRNLFFTGQLTVPGPGVPPAIISGEVVAKELIKSYEKNWQR